MKRGKYDYIRSIENLQEYVRDRMVRQEAGWVGGKVHLHGRFFTAQEFDDMFPAVMRYRSIQADGTQVRTN